LPEVLASLQLAGCTRSHLNDGTSGTDGAGSSCGLPRGCGLFGTNERRERRDAPMSPANTKGKQPAVATEKRVELLFEIGAEEIPAGMLPKAEEELRLGLEKLLTAEGLADGVTVQSFATPRRLVGHATGLLARQKDVVSEVTGPPKSVAYDSVGAPTRAAVSFAEKQGVGLHEVYTVQTPKGEYLAARHVKRG